MSEPSVQIAELNAVNFRTYTEICWRPCSRVSVLYGPNGAGKTNLLEAIAYGATGRSPRLVSEQDLLRFGADRFIVRLHYQVDGRDHRPTDLAIQYVHDQGRTVHRNGKRIAMRALIGEVPVVYFSPDDLWLIKMGPAGRRALLDALLSQAEPAYADAQTRYRRVLAQRNWALREIRRAERPRNNLSIWDPQLVHYGAEIMRRRAQAVVDLQPQAQWIFDALGDGQAALSLRYEPGCDLPAGREQETVSWEHSFGVALVQQQDRDIREGLTTVGPHRDDLGVFVNGHPARTAASQGQQRATSLAIRLAERTFLANRVGRLPVLLLDDVLSELDTGYRMRLREILLREGQVFLTTTDPVVWERNTEVTYFSVTNGQVHPTAP